ncbi:hypothetical protein BDF20DRAFT_977834 [Mycotypha africana]|uniref:uncharacterized protein n=1 Tax=Mycotypha africana TaxID=64632 RepID=UPI00230048F6|nr:uncharacterized protein BDF20DRAFT_977834 [Mycotypha africana]KAI8973452.1 hypothetical protein BDF20DRAFT_977834 [Mycotypha africana]
MSRIIVKNLPKFLTEEKFREHFAKKGEVTDVKLMKTAKGTSRRFGFIGYKTEQAAEAAIQYFNNTFISTSKITVEKAIAYKSEALPRPWSKYSEGSSAHEKVVGGSSKKRKDEFAVEETDAYKEKQQNQKDRDGFVNKLDADKKDAKLKEYLDVMTARSKSKTWANDDSAPTQQQEQQKEEEDTSTTVNYAASDDELYQDLPVKGVKKGQANKSSDIEEDKEDADNEDAVMKDDAETEETANTTIDTNLEKTADHNEDVDMEIDNDKANDNTMKSADPKELIEDTGRLFVRNLPYACTEQDLRDLFGQYGSLSEVHMPIAKDTKKPKGYAYILYLLPEHAVKAYEALDMQTFQGRLLHILPAQEKPPSKEDDLVGLNGTKLSSVKKEKEKKRRNLAGNDFNWNSLYMSADAVAESIADRLGVSKSEVLNAESDNMAVRLALAETQIINETKEFFEKHGIFLGNFSKTERSDTTILVKNIPYGTTEEDMRELFGKFGELGRVLIPPAKTIAVVEFLEPSEARSAFKSLAYRRYKDSLIYLEKAPSGIFRDKFVRDPNESKKKEVEEKKPSSAADLLEASSSATVDDGDSDAITSVFVKNLNFSTTPEALRNAFKGIEGYRASRINVKADPRNPGKTLSMGFGFVEFNNKSNAEKALNAMQGYILDGHALEMKLSHRKADTKSKKSKTPDTTKLVVRNVPFEATSRDLRELFSAYGQLKSLRMPKKFNGGHRGFAFLEFLTKQEAKNVYENMGNIHLYGRHLVLEWAQDDENVDALREKTGKHYSKEESLGGRVNKRQKVDLDANDEMLE